MITDEQALAALNEIRHAATQRDGTFIGVDRQGNIETVETIGREATLRNKAEAASARDIANQYMTNPEYAAAFARISNSTVDLDGNQRLDKGELVAWALSVNTNPQHDLTLNDVRSQNTDEHVQKARTLKPEVCGCPLK